MQGQPRWRAAERQLLLRRMLQVLLLLLLLLMEEGARCGAVLQRWRQQRLLVLLAEQAGRIAATCRTDSFG